MELAYMPDPMMRFNSWSVYSTWEETDSDSSFSKSRHYNPCRQTKINEKNCSICQKKKKRSLSDYIKSKQIDCQNSTSIQEEDEEEEEEEGSNATEGKKQQLS